MVALSGRPRLVDRLDRLKREGESLDVRRLALPLESNAHCAVLKALILERREARLVARASGGPVIVAD
jgi:hypothetical protein